MLPDPQAARARMTGRVKAIVLVTPNNPTGAEYPPALVAEFAALAREAGAARTAEMSRIERADIDVAFAANDALAAVQSLQPTSGA